MPKNLIIPLDYAKNRHKCAKPLPVNTKSIKYEKEMEELKNVKPKKFTTVDNISWIHIFDFHSILCYDEDEDN